MNMVQHDHEPVPGLPAPLPAGESILWQGAPDWKTLARRAMRTRVVSVYFLLLIIWGVSGGVSAATPPIEIALSSLKVAALGAVAVALLTLFAYLVGRTTLYTITTRRVMIRFGIALPMTIQVAYPMIESAGVTVWSNGAGDIAVTLLPTQRIGYAILWPHARPWKFTKAQPSFRSIPDAATVSQILGRALAASASQPATPVGMSGNEAAGSDARAHAAA
jgi:hypothetical protein